MYIYVGPVLLVTINKLVSIVEDIAQIKLTRKYDLNAPQGVRGRNSDNTLILYVVGDNGPSPGGAPDGALSAGLQALPEKACQRVLLAAE